MAHTRPCLREHGLSDQQWRILRLVGEHGSLEMGRVAREAYISGPSLTGVVARMERDGLILRERDQSDQRRTLVMATSKGLTMLKRLTQVIASHYRGLEESVGSHNLAKLHELLDQLIAHEQTEYIDRLPGEAVRAIVGRV